MAFQACDAGTADCRLPRQACPMVDNQHAHVCHDWWPNYVLDVHCVGYAHTLVIRWRR